MRKLEGPAPRFGLFEHDGRVFCCGENYPNHMPEDERPLSSDEFPVTVLVDAVDVQDGDGWGRSALEGLGTINDHYMCNVGAGEVMFAVSVTFPDEKNLLRALSSFDLHESQPDEL